ncbi:hypothetical protein EV356DRAFT_383226 [Viridothelium virens]|uniref:Uncharacterized protein n=1 Tax=Viridothelium virens TaxID=1048519 RepID=A0A6A6HHS4_VIRVR|nr:hypothetical protein EV356DRAFT_383226 [Viridothelium virens]
MECLATVVLCLDTARRGYATLLFVPAAGHDKWWAKPKASLFKCIRDVSRPDFNFYLPMLCPAKTIGVSIVDNEAATAQSWRGPRDPTKAPSRRLMQQFHGRARIDWSITRLNLSIRLVRGLTVPTYESLPRLLVFATAGSTDYRNNGLTDHDLLWLTAPLVHPDTGKLTCVTSSSVRQIQCLQKS